MRPDGTRVKEASTIVSALPYVMPRRYDAQNFITEYADMESCAATFRKSAAKASASRI